MRIHFSTMSNSSLLYEMKILPHSLHSIQAIRLQLFILNRNFPSYQLTISNIIDGCLGEVIWMEFVTRLKERVDDTVSAHSSSHLHILVHILIEELENKRNSIS